MTRFIEWTSFEIEQMKIAFLQGKTIKAMARQLGRTPTALNKALSRFGVRENTHKPIKIMAQSCIEWHRYLLPKKKSSLYLDDDSLEDDPLLPPSTSHILPLPKDNFLMNRDCLKPKDPLWVSLAKVIGYLERQGHRVKIKNAVLDDYQIDAKPVKAGYLLLLANRLRIEEGKPIFMVSEITW